MTGDVKVSAAYATGEDYTMEAWEISQGFLSSAAAAAADAVDN